MAFPFRHGAPSLGEDPRYREVRGPRTVSGRADDDSLFPMLRVFGAAAGRLTSPNPSHTLRMGEVERHGSRTTPSYLSKQCNALHAASTWAATPVQFLSILRIAGGYVSCCKGGHVRKAVPAYSQALPLAPAEKGEATPSLAMGCRGQQPPTRTEPTRRAGEHNRMGQYRIKPFRGIPSGRAPASPGHSRGSRR